VGLQEYFNCELQWVEIARKVAAQMFTDVWWEAFAARMWFGAVEWGGQKRCGDANSIGEGRESD